MDWIGRDSFREPERVSLYIVAFANKYLDAIRAHHEGRVTEVPAAWRLAFRSAESGGPVLETLFLGINAHINNDLPHATVEVVSDFSCGDSYRDFLTINDALFSAMPRVRHRVVEIHQPALWLGNRLVGRWMDCIVDRSFRKARSDAWEMAESLSRLTCGEELSRLSRYIEGRAETLGREILENTKAPFKCAAILGGEGLTSRAARTAPFA